MMEKDESCEGDVARLCTSGTGSDDGQLICMICKIFTNIGEKVGLCHLFGYMDRV